MNIHSSTVTLPVNPYVTLLETGRSFDEPVLGF
jgi:hypothetical protein